MLPAQYTELFCAMGNRATSSATTAMQCAYSCWALECSTCGASSEARVCRCTIVLVRSLSLSLKEPRARTHRRRLRKRRAFCPQHLATSTSATPYCSSSLLIVSIVKTAVCFHGNAHTDQGNNGCALCVLVCAEGRYLSPLKGLMGQSIHTGGRVFEKRPIFLPVYRFASLSLPSLAPRPSVCLAERPRFARRFSTPPRQQFWL